MRNLSPHDLSEGLSVRVGRGGIEPPNQSRFNLHTSQQLIVPINLPIFADRQISLNSICLISTSYPLHRQETQKKNVFIHTTFRLFRFQV